MSLFSELPELIIELANAHDGCFDTALSMIDCFSQVKYHNKSIKFQPLSADSLALPDYEWHPVYQDLYFNENEWHELIQQAQKRYGKVWLDIFDSYGVEILNKNKNRVSGIKLQASILDNQEVFEALEGCDLSDCELMLNFSAYSLNKIHRKLCQYKKLGARQIIIQVGFQSYPTKLEDTGLQKIRIIRAQYPHFKICFADHVSAECIEAIDIPVYATLLGCDYIEKHACIDRSKSKYDYYSALQKDEFDVLSEKLTSLMKCTSGPFISASECEYLNKTETPAISKKELASRTCVSSADLIFRRTAKKGLGYSEIKELQKKGYVLADKASPGELFSVESFKKAKVGVIIACRMKSSRLKNKAILDLKGKATVEWCLESCLQLESIDDVILATSDLGDDSCLEEYTKETNVKFWAGSPDDVISRYLGACHRYDIDVVVRVTADCPFISKEVYKILIESHRESGADYTVAKDVTIGLGCEIINTEALERAINFFGEAKHSEYMTWYFKNNPHVFKVNEVDLPCEYITRDRLTLDYQEDLDMFDRMLREIDSQRLEVSTQSILDILRENEEINSINQGLGMVYKDNQDLISLLNRETYMVVA